jgi:NADPH:quinone reductase-like Zn-dependent oxidoreductase
MTHHWAVHVDDGQLRLDAEESQPMTPPPDGVVVTLEATVIGPPELHKSGAGQPGLGVVTEVGKDASEWLGQRVLVPATVPVSDERLAALAVQARPHSGAYLATQLSVAARWLCPVPETAYSELTAALIAREAADAYALVVAANLRPKAVVPILGDSLVARFAAELCRYRSAIPIAVCSNDGVAQWAQTNEIAVSRSTPGGEEAVESLREQLRQHEGIAQHVIVADATSRYVTLACDVAAPFAECALLAGRQTASAPSSTIQLEGASLAGLCLRTVPGAHPDLIPEIAAIVGKGALDIENEIEVVTPGMLTTSRALSGPWQTLVVDCR